MVLTFVISDDAPPEDERDREQHVVQSAAKSNESWFTCFHPDERCARLHGLGFGSVVLLTPGEANTRYLGGRRDRMRVGPLEQLVSATA
jgi:hypothetical protein